MTVATNFTTAVLSSAIVQQMVGGPWWARAGAAFLTGYAVMVALMRVNPKP
jgi:hypothetical protein